MPVWASTVITFTCSSDYTLSDALPPGLQVRRPPRLSLFHLLQFFLESWDRKGHSEQPLDEITRPGQRRDTKHQFVDGTAFATDASDGEETCKARGNEH